MQRICETQGKLVLSTHPLFGASSPVAVSAVRHDNRYTQIILRTMLSHCAETQGQF